MAITPYSSTSKIMKKEISTNKDNIKNNSLGYFMITFIVAIIWCVLITMYKPFMKYVLNYNDVDKLFNLVMILLGFYILFAIQNVFDSTFYGLGKTNYMLFESIVDNVVYYGIAFILYKCNIWTPSLVSIALLFGIGMAFDFVVSLLAYLLLLRKYQLLNKC